MIDPGLLDNKRLKAEARVQAFEVYNTRRELRHQIAVVSPRVMKILPAYVFCWSDILNDVVPLGVITELTNELRQSESMY